MVIQESEMYKCLYDSNAAKEAFTVCHTLWSSTTQSRYGPLAALGVLKAVVVAFQSKEAPCCEHLRVK